jgi:2Fe-2S ferredoxin
MPIIKILPHPSTARRALRSSAPAGTSICEALLDNDINIEHACDMSCACTTCHVIVREGFASLNELDENEEDLLDRAWGLEPNSRLSCQAILAQQDVVVEIPKYTINHAARTTEPLLDHHPTIAGSSRSARCDRSSSTPKPPA